MYAIDRRGPASSSPSSRNSSVTRFELTRATPARWPNASSSSTRCSPASDVMHSVSVFKRPAIDYFRATRGLLVLTNKRLLYLGLEPRDLLAAPDLPPTFEERSLSHRHAGPRLGRSHVLRLRKAVVIQTPNETLKLGVPSSTWPKADLDDRRDGCSTRQSRGADRAGAAIPRERAEAQRKAAKRIDASRSSTPCDAATRSAASPRSGIPRPTSCGSGTSCPDNKIRVGAGADGAAGALARERVSDEAYRSVQSRCAIEHHAQTNAV